MYVSDRTMSEKCTPTGTRYRTLPNSESACPPEARNMDSETGCCTNDHPESVKYIRALYSVFANARTQQEFPPKLKIILGWIKNNMTSAPDSSVRLEMAHANTLDIVKLAVMTRSETPLFALTNGIQAIYTTDYVRLFDDMPKLSELIDVINEVGVIVQADLVLDENHARPTIELPMVKTKRLRIVGAAEKPVELENICRLIQSGVSVNSNEIILQLKRHLVVNNGTSASLLISQLARSFPGFFERQMIVFSPAEPSSPSPNGYTKVSVDSKLVHEISQRLGVHAVEQTGMSVVRWQHVLMLFQQDRIAILTPSTREIAFGSRKAYFSVSGSYKVGEGGWKKPQDTITLPFDNDGTPGATTFPLNLLLTRAFHGEAPSADYFPHHIDGDTSNYLRTNLEWKTLTPLPPSYARQLLEQGYVVIPAETFKGRKEEFLSEASRFQEFKKDLNPHTCQFVLGGFAALGNPSSFHNPLVRKFRQWAHCILVSAVFQDMVKSFDDPGSWKLDHIIGRMMIRRAGEQPTAETWHRDHSSELIANDDDKVFGGWINLDAVPQYFSCVPKTHIPNSRQHRGFAKFKKEDVKALGLKERAHRVEIPPGSILVFFENMIHEVLAKKLKYTLTRLFIAFRLTRSLETRPSNLMTKIDDQDVIMIKSGQIPSMHADLHWNLWRPTMEKFAKDNIKDELLITKTVLSGLLQGDTHLVCPNVMESLEEYRNRHGYNKYPGYTADEKRMHTPQRKWKLLKPGSVDTYTSCNL